MTAGRTWTLKTLVLTTTLVMLGGVALVCSAGDHTTGAAGGSAGAGSGTATLAAPASALALEDAIVAAADGMLESVVSIEVEVPFEGMGMFGMPFPEWDPFFFGPQPRPESEGEEDDEPPTTSAGGSGTIYSKDGYIVTNNHVVEDAKEIRVTLHDGRTFPAEIVGTDPESDLAVIKIDAKGLQPVRFADMDEVRPGQFAIAVGMPFMLDYSVTVGHVSALGRGGIQPDNAPGMGSRDRPFLAMQNFIQTDASINPGNSGGPLVTLTGDVMGINSIVQGGIGGGFGFAIPADLVQRVATQLIDSGKVSRAWIGLTMSNLTYEKAEALEIERSRGALVEEVQPGGPAEKAEIQRGDVIVAVDGHDVLTSGDVVYRVGNHMAGEKVELTYLRDGEERTVEFKTGDREKGLAQAMARLEEQAGGALSEPETAYGMELEAIGQEWNEKLDRPAKAGGVVVLSVVPGGPADRAGIDPGDVIVDVDGKEVSTPGQVFEVIEGTSKNYVPLSVERDGRQRFVALKKGE